MPIQASSIAREIDPLMWFIHGLTIFFTALICVATAYFAWRYRADKYPIADPPGHNNALEVGWTVLPSIIVFICFFWGFRVFMRMTTQQPAALQVDVMAQMWSWSFQYRNPNGGPDIKTDKLILPVNTPVELTLRSQDVIHAVYIPTMRVKKDVVPGRFNKIQVEPTKEGTFSLYCAEYCGDNHSRMLNTVEVYSPEKFKEELLKLADPTKDPSGNKLPPAEAGKKIASLNGCVSCHAQQATSDVKSGVGPGWKDLYGSQQPLSDGTSVLADDEYLLESIRNPNAKVVKNYGPPSAMNPFPPSQLPEEHVRDIIEYMKSISSHAPAGQTAPATAPVNKPAGTEMPPSQPK